MTFRNQTIICFLFGVLFIVAAIVLAQVKNSTGPNGLELYTPEQKKYLGIGFDICMAIGWIPLLFGGIVRPAQRWFLLNVLWHDKNYKSAFLNNRAGPTVFWLKWLHVNAKGENIDV